MRMLTVMPHLRKVTRSGLRGSALSIRCVERLALFYFPFPMAYFIILLKIKKAGTKQPKKSGVHFAEIDLNEDVDSPSETSEKSHDKDQDDEMEDGDSDEFIDVLAVFDGKGEADDESESGGVIKQDVKGIQMALKADGDSASEVEDEEDDEEGSDEEAIVLSASDGEDDPSPEALASLENFISTLDPSKKRKAPADDDGSTPADADEPRSRKRRTIKERTEAGLENEFGAQASGGFIDLFMVVK